MALHGTIAARHTALLAILALVASCAGQPPLAGPAVPSQPGWTPPVYLAGARIDSIALLGPPPAPGSEAAQQDLQGVLTAQRTARVAGTTTRAIADAQVSCTRLADALGGDPQAAGELRALNFATAVALQAATATGAAKSHWQRARPFVVSAEVERLADVAVGSSPATTGMSARDHSSYPSGHAAFGLACAVVLAQMVPERQAALFDRSRSYGESREIVGAHFPTDVEAGRLAGTAAMAVILQNPNFRRDLREPRAALRAVLGLPPALDAP